MEKEFRTCVIAINQYTRIYRDIFPIIACSISDNP